MDAREEKPSSPAQAPDITFGACLGPRCSAWQWTPSRDDEQSKLGEGDPAEILQRF